MIRARPGELREDVEPVLQATLPEEEVRRLIPVRFSQLDPLAEPEPSLGALLRLESGMLAVAVYGRRTGTLSLRLPEASLSRKALETLLKEIPIPSEAIRWRNPAVADRRTLNALEAPPPA